MIPHTFLMGRATPALWFLGSWLCHYGAVVPVPNAKRYEKSLKTLTIALGKIEKYTKTRFTMMSRPHVALLLGLEWFLWDIWAMPLGAYPCL